jgi:hypothetical protein
MAPLKTSQSVPAIARKSRVAIIPAKPDSRHLAIPRYQTTPIPFPDTSPHHLGRFFFSPLPL